MIEVRPHERYKRGFIVQGHADYAEHGQDIICAGISTIVQMIANEIHIRKVGTQKLNTGYINVQNHVDGFTSEIIDMMVRTLRGIAEQYPDHVKVYEEEAE